MHHELPARLDLDWYRKQAKALVRAYARRRGRGGRARRGDARRAGARALPPERRAVGDRAGARLPHVGRVRALGGDARARAAGGPDRARAGRWLRGARAGAGRAGCGRRGRGDAPRAARVPRLADFAGGELPLRDAKLVVAREYGFPTWRELVVHVEKAIREHEGQREGSELGRRRSRRDPRAATSRGCAALLDGIPSSPATCTTAPGRRCSRRSRSPTWSATTSERSSASTRASSSC